MAARLGDWWLAASEHVVTGQVPAPPGAVRDFYCDLHNITEVHPLVISVLVIGSEQSEDSRTVTYRVHDRIPFGPVTFKVSYTARMHVPDRGDVLTEARQFPRVRLDGRVSFDVSDGGTLVTERLRIIAPRPLAAMTVREAVTAHGEMLAGISRYFG